MTTHQTYAEARALIPEDARCTASFGNPGEGGYREHWTLTNGQRMLISNGPWNALRPFIWACSAILDPDDPR